MKILNLNWESVREIRDYLEMQILKPQKTVKGEIGIQQQIGDDIAS